MPLKVINWRIFCEAFAMMLAFRKSKIFVIRYEITLLNKEQVFITSFISFGYYYCSERIICFQTISLRTLWRTMMLLKIRHFYLRFFLAIIAVAGIIYYLQYIRNSVQDLTNYKTATDNHSDIIDGNVHLVWIFEFHGFHFFFIE